MKQIEEGLYKVHAQARNEEKDARPDMSNKIDLKGIE